MWLQAGRANRTGGHLLYRDIHAPLDLLPELAAAVHWQRELILLTTNWQQSGRRLLLQAPSSVQRAVAHPEVRCAKHAVVVSRLRLSAHIAEQPPASLLATQMRPSAPFRAPFSGGPQIRPHSQPDRKLCEAWPPALHPARRQRGARDALRSARRSALRLQLPARPLHSTSCACRRRQQQVPCFVWSHEGFKRRRRILCSEMAAAGALLHVGS